MGWGEKFSPILYVLAFRQHQRSVVGLTEVTWPSQPCPAPFAVIVLGLKVDIWWQALLTAAPSAVMLPVRILFSEAHIETLALQGAVWSPRVIWGGRNSIRPSSPWQNHGKFFVMQTYLRVSEDVHLLHSNQLIIRGLFFLLCFLQKSPSAPCFCREAVLPSSGWVTSCRYLCYHWSGSPILSSVWEMMMMESDVAPQSLVYKELKLFTDCHTATQRTFTAVFEC